MNGTPPRSSTVSPIYPATREQGEESFFVRYANQRRSRSSCRLAQLGSGNDFIGVPLRVLLPAAMQASSWCATTSGQALTLDIERFNEEARLSRAADRFYTFRTSDYTKYQKHKYANVFRYDTERDLFNAVEARRGTHRKDEYLNAIVTNLEAQTRDLEGRLRAKVDRQFSLLLAAVGIFSVLQVLYQVLDISTRGMDKISRKPIDMLDFEVAGMAQTIATYLFLSTSGFLIVTVLLTLWVLRQFLIRR
jgi:hypothetical protein